MPTNKIVAKMMLKGKKNPKISLPLGRLLMGYSHSFSFHKTHKHTLLSHFLPHYPTGTHFSPPSPPTFFRQDHWKTPQEKAKAHSSLLFDVKIPNLFCGFYTFA